MKKLSKFQKVKNHLKIFGSITSWEAIEKYKHTRLSAAIFRIKKQLLADPNSTQEIQTILHVKDGTRYAEYKLVDITNEK